MGVILDHHLMPWSNQTLTIGNTIDATINAVTDAWNIQNTD